MKKIIYILALLSPACFAGDYTIFKGGVQQGTTYMSEKTALIAAFKLSQACNGCDILVKFETVVSVKPVACTVASSASSLSSSSSSSSSVYVLGTGGATLKWQHPTRRENGQALAVSEIAGYQIKYNNSVVDIKGNQTLAYEFNQNAVGLVFKIAVVDTGGVWSDWVVMTALN